MTDKEIQHLARLCEEATPGPWEIAWEHDEGSSYEHIVDPDRCTRDSVAIITTDSNYYGPNEDDARFICAARDAVPVLIDQLAAAREEAGEAKRVANAWYATYAEDFGGTPARDKSPYPEMWDDDERIREAVLARYPRREP